MRTDIYPPEIAWHGELQYDGNASCLGGGKYTAAPILLTELVTINCEREARAEVGRGSRRPVRVQRVNVS